MNNNIDKKTLEELIQFHEQQIAANQRQIDELRGQFEPEPLPEVKPMFGQALTLEDIKFMLYADGEPACADGESRGFLAHGEYFISKEAAELEAEKRRLRQLARVRMAESWGDERPKENGKRIAIDSVFDVFEVKIPYALQFRCDQDANNFLEEVGKDGIRKILEL